MAGGARLEFNLTTTADIALVGVSLDSALGVDCEQVRPRTEMMAVARRMFAPRAVADLARLPESRRLEAFYRAWTALEADAKADGRGLFRPRASGAVPAEIRHAIPAAGHIAAVAREVLPPIRSWAALELLDAEYPSPWR
jgi:4'-phosphopantetheinyl transferase